MVADDRQADAHAADDRRSEAYELFRRGCAFLDARHPGQAALLLARAAELEPEKTSIHEALGRACYAMRRYASAADAFAAVIERAPTNAYAHFGLARSLLESGRPGAAVGHARLAVAMQPESGDFEAALSECLARLAAEHERSLDGGRDDDAGPEREPEG